MHEISLRQNEGILPKWYNLWYTFTTNQTKGFRRSMPVIFLRYDSRYDASDNMKKRKLVHGQRSVFRSEKCRHRVKPAIFCRGRFQFLDENSACFSHRCSGGHQHSFTLAELFCTKIWDKRKPLGCAADLDIHRPTDNLLTKTKFSSRGLGGGSAGWYLHTHVAATISWR